MTMTDDVIFSLAGGRRVRSAEARAPLLGASARCEPPDLRCHPTNKGQRDPRLARSDRCHLAGKEFRLEIRFSYGKTKWYFLQTEFVD